MGENKKSNAKLNFGPRGWVLVIYGLLFSFLCTCTSDSFKQLALHNLCNEKGWDYYDILSIAALFTWVNLIVYRLIGKALEKHSVRKLGFVLGGGFAVFAALILHVQSQVVLLIVYYLFATFMGAATQLVIPTYINNWFPRKKGVIIGITTAGFPFGAGVGIALYYLIGRVVSGKAIYLVYAGALMLACVCAFVFLPDYPEECGCYPDNDPTVSREEAQKILAAGKVDVNTSFWTPKRLLSTSQFWLVLICCGLIKMCTGSFTSCLVPRMMAAGYDQGAAVGFVTVATICGGIGSFIMGFVDAKVGPKNMISILAVIATVSCILNIIPGLVTALISMVGIGMILGGAANVLMSITTSMWGRYSFRPVYGVILPINELLGSCGSLMVARLAKTVYGFNLAYGIAAGFGVIMLIVSRFIKLDSIKKIEEENGVEILH